METVLIMKIEKTDRTLSVITGLNLILWALCGLIAMGGAFCFAELGTLVRESGGQWAYIRAGLGDAPAFVSAWMNIMLSSVTSSVISLSSGNYVLTNFTRRGCQVPVRSISLNVRFPCVMYIIDNVLLGPASTEIF